MNVSRLEIVKNSIQLVDLNLVAINNTKLTVGRDCPAKCLNF